MKTAEVVSPCYVDGVVAEVGEKVTLSEESFERLSSAKCVVEAEETPEEETPEEETPRQKRAKNRQMKTDE